MTRYFYTDPLAAAWMQERHGMQMTDANGDDVVLIGREYGINRKHGNVTPPPFYIHPDSLHLLNTQEDDLLFTIKERSSCYLLKPTDLLEGERIILRNNIPFMWPDSE